MVFLRTAHITKDGRQPFINGEIHDWYRIILGYTDNLVSDIIRHFGISESDTVLDPFCGSGTTLVECMKQNIPSVGIDANPSSYFAAKVKTNWNIKPDHLRDLLDKVRDSYCRRQITASILDDDPSHRYLVDSGMLRRGWISPKPLRKAIRLKRIINELGTNSTYRHALMLALVSELVNRASNVKFGPELYCGPMKHDVDVLGGYEIRVEKMASDLELVNRNRIPSTTVLKGDSRECRKVLSQNNKRQFPYIITSPPYPAEHDYTRNSRLELAFLGAVTSVDSLRAIKRTMIRSHTKGIYRSDSDADRFLASKALEKIARSIDRRAITKTHGFARLYSTVLREYFGGMARHLQSAHSVLESGGRCAYVVGDQSSYLQVHVPTAEILADIAKSNGFIVDGIEIWRERSSTTTARIIKENILFLSKPS